jgi:hypothetical protein
MLLVEVVGKVTKVLPEQIGATAVKVGEILVAIVTKAFAVHPLMSVYVIVVVPLVNPVTSPVELILATAGELDTQGRTSAGVPVPVNCELLPLQKVSEPVIVGFGFTTILRVVLIVH